LATDPEVWVRFPALTDFLRSSGSGKRSLNFVSTIEELLGRKSSGSGLENRAYGLRDSLHRQRDTVYPKKFVTNFAEKRWSLGRYSSLADSSHGVLSIRLLISNSWRNITYILIYYIIFADIFRVDLEYSE
jgi:hypothetical protein